MIERLLYEERGYTLQVPYGHRVYAPWYDKTESSDFHAAMDAVRRSGRVTVSPDRCYILYQLSRRSLLLDGEMAECGVYVGSTALLLCHVLRSAAKPPRLHLFDTFEGMPETEPGRDYHRKGDFSDTSLAGVKERLRGNDFCEFHQGVIPESFREVEDVDAYSFVHIDVDIYDSTLECCRWFWPRLRSGGALVCDDYGFYPYRHAAKAAVDDFFKGEREVPIALPTGQAVVIKI
jgi:predicted O-methyltransferase YrrM